MIKHVSRYFFVIVLAASALFISYRLNRNAYINNLELFEVLHGKYPERLRFTPQFKKNVEQQIENAVKSKVHLFVTTSFKRQLNHPNLFMSKLQDVLYWHTSNTEQYKFNGNSYSFYITCGTNRSVHVGFTVNKIKDIYYLETISGFDTALIEANRVLVARPVYNVKAITLPVLDYDEAFNYFDTAAVQIGILSGEYDTSIHQSVLFTVKPKQLLLPPITYHNAVEQIHSVRDCLYKLIPVAHHASQLSDSLERENFDTLVQRLLRLEYGGSCAEHAIIVKRALQNQFTTSVFTLKKDSGQLVDHVIDLVYYRIKGIEYAVTVDALLGVIGPVKSNGNFYNLNELQNVVPLLNYPKERKTKRYTIDTLTTFSNVFIHQAKNLYSDNGFVYYEWYDDILILRPKELLEDKMPRQEFEVKYARVLADVLLKNVPASIKNH